MQRSLSPRLAVGVIITAKKKDRYEDSIKSGDDYTVKAANLDTGKMTEGSIPEAATPAALVRANLMGTIESFPSAYRKVFVRACFDQLDFLLTYIKPESWKMDVEALCKARFDIRHNGKELGHLFKAFQRTSQKLPAELPEELLLRNDYGTHPKLRLAVREFWRSVVKAIRTYPNITGFLVALLRARSSEESSVVSTSTMSVFTALSDGQIRNKLFRLMVRSGITYKYFVKSGDVHKWSIEAEELDKGIRDVIERAQLGRIVLGSEVAVAVPNGHGEDSDQGPNDAIADGEQSEMTGLTGEATGEGGNTPSSSPSRVSSNIRPLLPRNDEE